MRAFLLKGLVRDRILYSLSVLFRAASAFFKEAKAELNRTDSEFSGVSSPRGRRE